MHSSVSSSGQTISAWRRLATEPLLQFLLIGSLLLLSQRLLTPPAALLAGAEQIHISQQALANMRSAFAQDNGRPPNDEDIQAMIQRHVDGEVLYREAIRYGLDRSDVIVRREMQRKMRFLIEDVTPLPEPEPQALQAWLDEHAQDYARPRRISFQQVFLSRARHGQDLELAAAEVLARLRRDPQRFAELSDPFPSGLQFEQASEQAVIKAFGGQLARAAFALSGETWSEPLRSSLGLHILRITERLQAEPVGVADAGPRLLADFRQAQRQAANRRALDSLRARYTIAIEAQS